METPSPRLRPALIVANVAALVVEVLFVGSFRSMFPWLGDETTLLALALVAAPVAPGLLLLARTVARALLRATGVDPLAAVRRWVGTRSRAVNALLVAPSVLGLAVSLLATSGGLWSELWRAFFGPHTQIAGGIKFVLGLWVLPAFGLALVAHASLRALLAPLAGEAKGSSQSADGFLFSAVAVTPETRGAVGVLSLASIAAAVLFAVSPIGVLTSPGVLGVLIAYVAAAVGATVAFHRASRIALGFDGVFVTGTSRRRFFAYRELDEVEAARGGDLVLRRQGRVVLRLQLHGEDAARSAAIQDRLRAGIARAREPGGGGAHALAEAASTALLARAARGDADYRTTGATREEVWELLEAPATAGATRAAAAAALAPGLTGAGRARLRVAAETCAEPATREALLRIAGDDEAEHEDSFAEPPVPGALNRLKAR